MRLLFLVLFSGIMKLPSILLNAYRNVQYRIQLAGFSCCYKSLQPIAGDASQVLYGSWRDPERLRHSIPV